jgi:hypothetical protein
MVISKPSIMANYKWPQKQQPSDENQRKKKVVRTSPITAELRKANHNAPNG